MAYPEDKIFQIEDELPKLRARLDYKTGSDGFGNMSEEDRERTLKSIAEKEDILKTLKSGETP